MRKTIALILVISLLMSLGISSVSTSNNDDFLLRIISNGIMQGDGSGSFNPEGYFTVEQLMTVLARMTGNADAEREFPLPTTFSDVSRDHWASRIIGWAQANHYTLGRGDGTFGLGDRVNGTRLSIFMLRALGYSVGGDEDDYRWQDAYEIALTMGIIDESIGADEELTRIRVAKVLDNTLFLPVKGDIESLGFLKAGYSDYKISSDEIDVADESPEDLNIQTDQAQNSFEFEAETIPVYNDSSVIYNTHELKDIMYRGFLNRVPEMQIRYKGNTDTLSNDIERIFDEIFDEDQYLGGSFERWHWRFEGYTNDVTITIQAGYVSTLAQEQAVNVAVAKILSQIIAPSMSELEKVKAVNDYIVLNTEYSYDTSPGISPHSAYAIIAEGKAVCQGYALLAYKLLSNLGIEVRYVGGYAGEPHAWNLVKVGGSWYHLDTTWNDPTPNVPSNVRYEYFLINDSAISSTHSWDRSKHPAATSTTYHWMRRIKHATTHQGVIYYSNRDDNDRLYRVNIDGTNNIRLTNQRAYYNVYHNGYIYFSNYSRGGHLHRAAIDGTNLMELNQIHSIDLKIIDGVLHFKDGETGAPQTLTLGMSNHPFFLWSLVGTCEGEAFFV